MIVHVQISIALFLNKCPEKLMWTIRAKQLCGVEDKYMCLYDTNARSFRELCKESPEFHRPGKLMSTIIISYEYIRKVIKVAIIII